jgi:GNAT superfamily N-acetyltransferase
MVLRAAAPSDVPVLADAWYAMLDECGLLRLPVDPEWREPLIEAFNRGLSLGRQQWLVVEVDGRVAATGGLFMPRVGASALAGRTGTIAGVYTFPSHRRRGFARAILCRLIELGREGGCHTIRLRASAQGRPLYEHLGFLPADEMQLPLL